MKQKAAGPIRVSGPADSKDDTVYGAAQPAEPNMKVTNFALKLCACFRYMAKWTSRWLRY